MAETYVYYLLTDMLCGKGYSSCTRQRPIGSRPIRVLIFLVASNILKVFSEMFLGLKEDSSIRFGHNTAFHPRPTRCRAQELHAEEQCSRADDPGLVSGLGRCEASRSAVQDSVRRETSHRCPPGFRDAYLSQVVKTVRCGAPRSGMNE